MIQAVKSGATTLMGSSSGPGPACWCQAGFCGPRVTKILARELGVSEKDITKKGNGSVDPPYGSKELLSEREG